MFMLCTSSSSTFASVGVQQCLLPTRCSKWYPRHALAQDAQVCRTSQQKFGFQIFVKKLKLNFLEISLARPHTLFTTVTVGHLRAARSARYQVSEVSGTPDMR